MIGLERLNKISILVSLGRDPDDLGLTAEEREAFDEMVDERRRHPDRVYFPLDP